MASAQSFEGALREAKAGKKTEPLHRTMWRVIALLAPEERKWVIPMAIATMVSSIVELAGIAVVIPVIGVAVKPDMVARSPRLGAIFEWSGMTSGVEFAQTATLIMCAVVTFKVVFSLFVQWWQTKFSFDIAHRLSGVMWDFNFSQSLEDLINRSSGKVLTEINAWPIQFAKRGMFAVIALISEVLIISMIGVALLLYKPLVMIGVGSIIGIGSLFLRMFVKHRVTHYNAIQKEAGPKAMGALNNAVRGVREIVTFNAVGVMRKTYLASNKANFEVNANLFLLNQIPRPLYEWLSILAIGAAILISFGMDIRNEDFLSMLTFLALGAYRVMPAVSRIAQRSLELRSTLFVIESMEKGIAFQQMQEEEARKPRPEGAMPTTTDRVQITLNGLTYQYSKARIPVFSGLDQTFPAGQMTAIVGPSGSGKTTLINVLMGLNRPTSGSITIDAVSSDKRWTLDEDLRRTDWLNITTYLSQSPFLFPGTVRDNLTMRIPDFDLDEAKTLALIDRLGMTEALDPKKEVEDEDAPQGSKKKDKTALDFVLKDGGENLSGGQQQRLGLLRSLQVFRPVMILDEATSDLDTQSRDRVFELLRERCADGCTVLMVTHDPEIAGRCDHVMDLGR